MVCPRVLGEGRVSRTTINGGNVGNAGNALGIDVQSDRGGSGERESLDSPDILEVGIPIECCLREGEGVDAAVADHQVLGFGEIDFLIEGEEVIIIPGTAHEGQSIREGRLLGDGGISEPPVDGCQPVGVCLGS